MNPSCSRREGQRAARAQVYRLPRNVRRRLIVEQHDRAVLVVLVEGGGVGEHALAGADAAGGRPGFDRRGQWSGSMRTATTSVNEAYGCRSPLITGSDPAEPISTRRKNAVA